MNQSPSDQAAAGPSVRKPGSFKKRAVSELEGSSSEKIHLRVVDQEGSSCDYYIPRNLAMQKFLRRYCQDKNLEYLSMIFLYEGNRVRVRSTPAELHLADGDQIDAMVYAGGGGHSTV
ncbi:OLC1v1019161C1 [Oldenlandia corymbosa var. corymbosa]|uniref:OLC1v1019161C1 n=1 Tax=Oldenlandia corymbosa var. corymbosa TaxID=529605 RepID=A0AAV1EDQ4_OLDCO|nr:OLC1v1019161C1 [Oldenlandia corymbosa var. corymbosa]